MTAAKLDDQVAIVTGGARGIGRAIVRRLLREGARVCSVDLDAAAGTRACDEDCALGALLFVRGDVSDPELAQAAVSQTVEELGSPSLLVNNAGIANPENPPLEELELQTWDRMLAVDLTGPMLMARAAAPHLRTGRGAIVNITSTRAHMSEPHTEAYTAAKGGLVALTHALAISLGPEVRVNCISPGWIHTGSEPLRPVDHQQHPVGRVGTVEDIASLTVWLLGAEAGFVTGQEFVIDGGMTRRMSYAP